jgi:hypothetical protein
MTDDESADVLLNSAQRILNLMEEPNGIAKTVVLLFTFIDQNGEEMIYTSRAGLPITAIGLCHVYVEQCTREVINPGEEE